MYGIRQNACPGYRCLDNMLHGACNIFGARAPVLAYKFRHTRQDGTSHKFKLANQLVVSTRMWQTCSTSERSNSAILAKPLSSTQCRYQVLTVSQGGVNNSKAPAHQAQLQHQYQKQQQQQTTANKRTPPQTDRHTPSTRTPAARAAKAASPGGALPIERERPTTNNLQAPSIGMQEPNI